jgi:hypothetical protein
MVSNQLSVLLLSPSHDADWTKRGVLSVLSDQFWIKEFIGPPFVSPSKVVRLNSSQLDTVSFLISVEPV